MSALTMAVFSSRSARAALSALDLGSRRVLCEFVMGCLSLIPASAECSIELNDRGDRLALERGEIEFTSEEVSLRVEDLQVAAEPSLISVSRQPRGVPECAIDRSLVVDDQQSRRRHSAEHGGVEWAPRRRASVGCDDKRQHAEQKRKRGHELPPVIERMTVMYIYL